MSHRLTRLTIDLLPSEHKQLKMAASQMEVSMKQLVLMSFDDFMQKKLNKLTKKTLKHSKMGKNLKKFDSLDGLLDEFGS